MRIGIDIDDTISNTYEISLGYAFKFNSEELKKESNIDSIKCDNHFYIRTIFGWSREEELKFWFKYYKNIVDNVDIKPFAKEIINKLKDEGNTIYLITARFSDENYNVENDTINWLDKQGIKYDKIFLNAEDKKKIVKDNNIDIFIDDSISNLNSMDDLNIKKLLMDSRMNLYEENKTNPNVKRVYSWIQIYDEIRREQ